ncbi:small conductance mechanosensitive channel [Sporosarcina luteola]|nr:small conductance mechanosensitive channel [Sporosarcina luteola]
MVAVKEPTLTIIERIEDFIFDEKLWINVGFHALKILFIILLAAIVVRIGKVVIRRVFGIKLKGPLRKDARREQTLLRLLENVLSYVVYFSAIVAVLSEFNIDLKGILAGAGVLGLAVGFGAQSLVKDVISGFFIIFEDQFSVGDYVKIGSTEGEVEEIGLRTTKIKSFTGELTILPNGSIAQVVNYSVKNSLAIVDVTIPFELGVEKVEKSINAYLAQMAEKDEDLIGTPRLVGAHDFTDTAIIERVLAETKPMRQYEVTRKISIGLKQYMEQQNVEIPYPTLVTKSNDA